MSWRQRTDRAHSRRYRITGRPLRGHRRAPQAVLRPDLDPVPAAGRARVRLGGRAGAARQPPRRELLARAVVPAPDLEQLRPPVATVQAAELPGLLADVHVVHG